MGEPRETPIEITQFERCHSRDKFNRIITFYLSKAASPTPLPLSVFIQGSGCHSVFRLNEEGKVCGGYQNLLLQVAQEQVRVLVVEKPGVQYLDNPTVKGTAENCSKTFLEEHTISRWAEALSAALRAVQTRIDIDGRKLLVVGHSEGGIVAARLAAEHPDISHVAILSSSGPTQLFDLVEEARTPVNSDEPVETRQARVCDVYKTFACIQADPESATKMAWGHPYRRWSSFLATSTLDELLRSQSRVYLAHGSNDPVVPVAAFEVLRAELVRHGHEVTAERFEGADHSFRMEGQAGVYSMTQVLNHVMNWFADNKL